VLEAPGPGGDRDVERDLLEEGQAGVVRDREPARRGAGGEVRVDAPVELPEGLMRLAPPAASAGTRLSTAALSSTATVNPGRRAFICSQVSGPFSSIGPA
jgi:hypothetical protein